MSTLATPAAWLSEAKKNARWLILFGFVEMVVGVLAITSPLIAGVAVTVMVAVFLLVGGVTRIFGAIKAGSWGADIFGLLVGILALICGVVILARPVIGLGTLALLLAIYLYVVGITGIILALRIRSQPGWFWTLANGILSLILGVFIMFRWPLSGLLAVGVLLGIHIFFSGWTMAAVGLKARRLPE